MLGFLCFGCLSAIFENICMESTWIRESSFNLENRVCLVGEGRWNFGCVGSGGSEKSMRSRGRA